ncbi:AraC family transcriptional regulator [Puia sp.]|jgi:AraC-like DNA-binding protein|uniref:helix-turn-helix domain-containing protein n=1 Tax=Puia sp. TaxID=2045100 RepID=UPI002F3E8797
MIVRDYLPDPAFREFVRCYRIVHFEFDKTAEFPFKAYPPLPEECLHFFTREGEQVELLNAKKKDYQLPIVLVGQLTSVLNRFLGRDFLNFQVVFQPTGLYRLTGIPSFELTNQYLDAEDIFSKNIRFILEQLRHAGNYTEMLQVADKFVDTLIKGVRKSVHQLDSVSKLMMQRDGNVSLDWLARESCLCPKQFRRKFNERAGVNPKTYTKIIRFSKAFNTKNANPDWDWLRIALECDYFDYQHLVKDYKDLTGVTPNELHLLEGNSPERRLGLTDEVYQSRLRLPEPVASPGWGLI